MAGLAVDPDAVDQVGPGDLGRGGRATGRRWRCRGLRGKPGNHDNTASGNDTKHDKHDQPPPPPSPPRDARTSRRARTGLGTPPFGTSLSDGPLATRLLVGLLPGERQPGWFQPGWSLDGQFLPGGILAGKRLANFCPLDGLPAGGRLARRFRLDRWPATGWVVCGCLFNGRSVRRCPVRSRVACGHSVCGCLAGGGVPTRHRVDAGPRSGRRLRSTRLTLRRLAVRRLGLPITVAGYRTAVIRAESFGGGVEAVRWLQPRGKSSIV
ncbi:hypothetical protein ACRAKI_22835 [Saccharothrix isguenensis]